MKSALLHSLVAEREALEKTLVHTTSLYDSKRNQLLENETWNQLNALEGRLKQVEGMQFEMNDCEIHINNL